ncbi:MAG TPA: phosphatase PAP2 family protein [Gemmatimonadaceae bacterium]|nr:phosphatase PAP2 family protein [Gemmatimonadaceae bacterium]
MRTLDRLLTCVLLSWIIAPTARAQTDSVRVGGPRSRLFIRSDAALLATSLAFATLISLEDRAVAAEVTETSMGGTAFGRFSSVGASIGGVGPIAFASGLWVSGHLASRPLLAHLGKWSIESIAISGAATAVLKGVVGRKRPYAANGDADIYALGHGFGHYAFESFPSGHTSAAFAVATVLSLGTRNSSPLVHRTVSALAYTASTAVGLSRLYLNQHWSSDVIVGAAIGATAGLAIVRRNDAAFDRGSPLSVSHVLAHMSVAPNSHHGLVVGYSIQ